MPMMLVELKEEERQLVLLAIAEMALSRPGWNYVLGEIADNLGGRGMFEDFKRLNADRIKPTPGL